MIKEIKVGALDTNCYIVFDDTKEALVVDPGYTDDKITNFIEENGLKVKYIYLTHGHFDHIFGADFVKQKTGAQILTFYLEEANMEDSESNLSMMLVGENFTVKPDKLLFENDEIEFGNTIFRVIHTPGHTAGSSSLYDGKNLISGDTIFVDTVGRTDFPTGSLSDMLKTREKLLSLPKDTVVYPGHGDTTTIEAFSKIEI